MWIPKRMMPLSQMRRHKPLFVRFIISKPGPKRPGFLLAGWDVACTKFYAMSFRALVGVALP
jgi:hypothetical protein